MEEKLRKSCDYCHRLKRKCSRTLPCAMCQSRRQMCIYSSRTQRTQHNAHKKPRTDEAGADAVAEQGQEKAAAAISSGVTGAFSLVRPCVGNGFAVCVPHPANADNNPKAINFAMGVPRPPPLTVGGVGGGGDGGMLGVGGNGGIARTPAHRSNHFAVRRPPIVFQCSQCSFILGHTTASEVLDSQKVKLGLQEFVQAEAAPGTSLHAVMTVSHAKYDEGSGFRQLACANAKCKSLVGRTYYSTPLHMDHLRGVYLLCAPAITSYELSAEHSEPQPNFNLSPRGPSLLNGASAAAAAPAHEGAGSGGDAQLARATDMGDAEAAVALAGAAASAKAFQGESTSKRLQNHWAEATGLAAAAAANLATPGDDNCYTPRNSRATTTVKTEGPWHTSPCAAAAAAAAAVPAPVAAPPPLPPPVDARLSSAAERHNLKFASARSGSSHGLSTAGPSGGHTGSPVTAGYHRSGAAAAAAAAASQPLSPIEPWTTVQ
eukprot:TRINITY_DN2627_c0_g1_i1.p1 TRINITY_DN2627_c0_g1~~TRINITY_DN2627_c0_g1_i1.p1  ORF type:complete len:489 (-),score=106.31 TRINITY_DN2627_c0_g1_i1:615-2081(-)